MVIRFIKRILSNQKLNSFHNINRERGSIVLAIPFTIIFFFAISTLFDLGMARLTKQQVWNSLETSLLAAGIDWTMTNGSAPIDRNTAITVVNQYLQINLHLDSSNNPLPSSMINSTLTISQFYVLNSGDIDPVIGDTVDNPSIGALVTTTAPLYMSKAFFSGSLPITEYARVALVP